MKSQRLVAIAAIVLVAGLWAAPLQAAVLNTDPVPISVTGGVSGQTPSTATWNMPITSDGTFNWERSSDWGNSDWMMGGLTDSDHINLYGNVDPVLGANFSVVNTSGVTQSFSFSFTLPVTPIVSATLTGGSVGVTLTDQNGNGATLGVSGAGAMYDALIDGVSHQTLNLLPLSAGTYLSNSGNTSFGTPIPNQSGPSVVGTLGLDFNFTLTPGDRAAFTAVFVVDPVPEPTSVTLLLGAGSLILLRRGKHRS